MNYLKTLYFLVITIFIVSCNTQKKMQVLQPTIPLISSEYIAPGTCNLQISNCKLNCKNKQWILSGEITNIFGYGSGFSANINNGDKLLIRINIPIAKAIKKQTTVCCNISYTLGNGEYYQLNTILPMSSNKK